MKLTQRIKEAMKPLDKAMQDLDKKMKDHDAESKEIKAKKVKVLGKRSNIPFWDMSDDEIKKVYGVKAKDMIKKKNDIKAKQPKQKSLTSKIKSKSSKDSSIEDQLLSGVLNYRGSSSTEKNGIITVENPDGKNKFKAIINTKKKEIKFRGHSDDTPFVIDRAKKLKYKSI